MDSDCPKYTSSNSDYILLKRSSFNKKDSEESWRSSAFVRREEIDSVPGFWIYEHYTVRNLKKLRILHSLGFISEVLAYVTGTIIKNVSGELANSTPFSINLYFVTAMWGLIILLAFALTLSLFSKSFNMFTVLTDQLRYYQFPLYIILSTFLITKSFYHYTVVNFVNVFSLLVAGVFIVMIYYKVKYEDDGRFFVSRLEFLGVHVQYSVLTAWILIEFCVSTIATLDKWDHYSRDGKFLGWKTSYWTITIMTVTFGLSVIMLYKFRDVFFAFTFSIAYFGVYTNHVINCEHCSCDDRVRTTSLVFGILMLIFAAITVFFYPKIVFYMKRRNSRLN